MPQTQITPELYEFIVKIIEDKVRDIKVTREEFEKLTSAVKELAEAQKRTEERIGTLTEQINALAEAQKRTEERLDALAEAQKRTEERVEALAESLDKLAEAQKRTEETVMLLVESVDKLTKGLGELRREVGRLSEVVGFGLEDIARVILPGWLYRHLNVKVEELRREFFLVEGEEVEVNLFGKGFREGEEVLVIGEVRSRIYGSDVNRFYWKVVKSLEKLYPDVKIIGVLFGYLVHPSARKKAEELGLYVVASYER